jgi:hypothetical protein
MNCSPNPVPPLCPLIGLQEPPQDISGSGIDCISVSTEGHAFPHDMWSEYPRCVPEQRCHFCAQVPELNVQNGVLKALSFLFEYIGEMGKDYIYSVSSLLEDALMDRDLVRYTPLSSYMKTRHTIIWSGVAVVA